jgi:serine/threonine protein kinase
MIELIWFCSYRLGHTKSALSPTLWEEHKDFTEFIKNQRQDKLSRHLFKMLGVSDVTAIQFEENDGTEIAFTDLFEYRTSIGAGGFGFVVAALDKATGEEVALKLLFKDNASDKVIELFKKEASLIELFDHPNVVKFRFLKNFSNYLWLGMELWVGGNLNDWIQRQRIISYESDESYEEKWALIIKNILVGVQYIHDKHEMLHRDIKPGNILFLHKDDLNSLEIWDFGLANNVGIGLFDQNYEKVGTIMYQAPELINETPSYGKAADIWAVGMILYELLSKGGHPILGKDIHHNLRMTVEDYK